MNNFVMMPWQTELFKAFKRMFKNPSNKVMCILARRQVMHKSASMLVCALHALTNSEYGVYGFFSPTYKQCAKQLNELKKWYDCFNLHCTLKFNMSDLYVTCSETKSKLQFFSLEAYDNVRGETLDGAFIDESAFISDAAIGVVYPMLDVNNGFMVCASTPWLRKGWFYNLCYDKDTEFIDWTQYDLSDIVSEDRLAFYKRTLSPTLYKTDILGQWMDNGESLLYGNIADCIEDDIDYEGNDELYVGIDIATGVNDYCAVSAWYKKDGMAVEAFTKRFRNGDVTSNVDRMYEILSGLKNVKIVMVETNGVGLPVYQLLKKRCRDASRMDLVRVLKEDYWTGQSKGKAVSDSVLWFSTKNIRLHTQILIDECQSYTEIVGKDGKISFGNAHQGDKDYHDDCWCAALHALSGLRTSSSVGKYVLS